MARRRRALSFYYCSSAMLPVDLVCFEERTSSVFFNFAQNRRRRFTDFGVSLVASDADFLRTLSLLPTAAVGSFSEPSDLMLNGESMVSVTKVSGSFQIWRACSPTSVFLLFVVDRELFSVYNGSSTHQSLQSSAVSTAWTTSHHALHSHAARTSEVHVPSVCRRHGRQVPELGQTLWMELLSYWAWPINDFITFRLMGSFGSGPNWRFCMASPSSLIVSLEGALPTGSQLLSRTIASDVVCCRCGKTETSVHRLFNCPFARKVWSLAPTTLGLPCDLLQDVRSGFVRAKQQTGPPPTRKVWSLAPTTLGLPYDLLQDVRSGFVRAKQQTGIPPTVCCSETSFSIIFKGSSNWCLVAFGIVAEIMIVFSGLVAKAISNNRTLLVCIVSHGTFSPPASLVVKEGLCDDFVCLRIGTVCLYLFIYCSYAFILALVATLLLISMVMNFMFVINSSRVGE